MNSAVTAHQPSAVDKTKIDQGLELYKRQSSALILNCMMLAGFEGSEINEFSPLYIHFMEMALEYEFERLKVIKKYKEFGPKIASSKIKDFLNALNIRTTNNCKFEKLSKAMIRYRYDSCFIMVKCMTKAGFSSSDTEIYDHTYQYFLNKAINIEYVRCKNLRLTMLENVKGESKEKKQRVF